MEKEEIIKQITNRVENVVDRYNKKLKQLATIWLYSGCAWSIAFLFTAIIVPIFVYGERYCIAYTSLAVHCVIWLMAGLAYYIDYRPQAIGDGPMDIYMCPEAAATWTWTHRKKELLPFIQLSLLPEYAPLLHKERYHKKGTLTDNQFITDSVLYLITQFKLKSLQT
jgi:hypothetical protein